MNWFQFWCTPSPQSFSQSAQVSKAINSGAVPIRPTGLQRVTAYNVKTDELKTLVRVRHMRPQEITQHVGFAAASCTGTATPQYFQFEKRLCAVVPGNAELSSDLLNIRGLESHLSLLPPGAFAEDRRAYSHKRCPFLDGYPKVLRHSHRKR